MTHAYRSVGVPEILKGVEQLLMTPRECSASGPWRANDIAVLLKSHHRSSGVRIYVSGRCQKRK